MPDETYDLPIGCPECGGKLMALVGPPEPTPRSPWQCPYCGVGHETDFGGKLHWITKRWESVAKA